MDSAPHAVLSFINICILQRATEAEKGVSPEKPGPDLKAKNAKKANTQQRPRLRVPHSALSERMN